MDTIEVVKYFIVNRTSSFGHIWPRSQFYTPLFLGTCWNMKEVQPKLAKSHLSIKLDSFVWCFRNLAQWTVISLLGSMQMSEGLDCKGYGSTKFCEILESGEFRMDLLYMQQCAGVKTWAIVEMSPSHTKQHDSLRMHLIRKFLLHQLLSRLQSSSVNLMKPMDLVNIGLYNSLLHDSIKALYLKLSNHQYVCICVAHHF